MSVADISVRNVDKENIRLKERNEHVERQYALLKIELEELEIKFTELKDVNNRLDDKAEELFENNSELKKQNATFVNDMKKEQERSKIELSNHKTEESKRNKDNTDLIEILEVTLENKDTEVNDLKRQLSKAFSVIDNLKHDSNLAQFGCQICEYKASTEELLQKHIEKQHEPTCTFCELTFKTSEELEKHTCKISISNAEFKQLYLKNWILTHGCTRIFKSFRNKQIANVIHLACTSFLMGFEPDTLTVATSNSTTELCLLLCFRIY